MRRRPAAVLVRWPGHVRRLAFFIVEA
jgi:hypothetical protein